MDPLTAAEASEALRDHPPGRPVAVTCGGCSRTGVLMVVHEEPSRLGGREFVVMDAG